MVKCIYCGEYVELPYKCKLCEELFCGDHRLSENHECIGLKSTIDTHYLVTSVFNPVFNDLISIGLARKKSKSVTIGGLKDFVSRGSPYFSFAVWLEEYRNNLLSSKIITKDELIQLTKSLIYYVLSKDDAELSALTFEYLDKIDNNFNTKLRKMATKAVKNEVKRHKKRIFLISDLHLDHTNIIEYCNRPFKSKYEMNKKIQKNWNNKINNSDTVYFLGDLVFGKGRHSVGFWLKRLKGTIILIKGSHDKFKRGRYKNFEILNYRDYEFLLIHDPKYAPKWWRGWIIHGHYHNNDLDNFPFIDGIKRTINVSAELLNYTPISIDELLDLGINN